jgi:hypothetical protein
MHIRAACFFRYFFVTFLCFWLSACSGASAQPTVSPSNSPFPKSTIFATITSTIALTYTPTSQPSCTPQPPKPTPTIDTYSTQIAGFPLSCKDFSNWNTSISPNGNWLAVSCGYKTSQTLEIVKATGGRWTLYFKDYLLDEFKTNGESNAMGNLYPIHWTNDETYLYFASIIAFDGGGTCFYGFGVQGLYRINLVDEKVSMILPSTSGGYDIAFSPTGRRLAYQGSGEPVILDLQTGEETIIKVGDNITGNFTWSPDGKELAYGTCQMYQDGNGNYLVKKSGIRIFSIQEKSSRTVLELEKNFLTIDGWSDDNVIKVENEDFQAGNFVSLYIDAPSGNLVAATPTP